VALQKPTVVSGNDTSWGENREEDKINDGAEADRGTVYWAGEADGSGDVWFEIDFTELFLASPNFFLLVEALIIRSPNPFRFPHV
jgi:hypothetical protein